MSWTCTAPTLCHQHTMIPPRVNPRLAYPQTTSDVDQQNQASSRDARPSGGQEISPQRMETYILWHRQAEDGDLEYVHWAPRLRSENQMRRIAPKQLTEYSERMVKWEAVEK